MAQRKAAPKSAARSRTEPGGMSFSKSPPELVAAFERAFPADPRAERRSMFGYPAGFVNGNMFAGLHQGSFVVRLPDEQREELLRLPGAGPFEPMPGRPMRGYATLPPDLVADAGEAGAWTQRAFDHVAAMPPKPAKSAAKKGAAKTSAAKRTKEDGDA